jgi:NSS family neurotransmitter:Na+ symporter
MTSLINLYETPVATVQEKLGLSRKMAAIVTCGVGAGAAILIQGIVSGWMDILSIYICPLGAGLAAVMFFWICGKDYVIREVNKGRDKSIGSWFYPLCKYVLCPVCFLVLILGWILGGIG